MTETKQSLPSNSLSIHNILKYAVAPIALTVLVLPVYKTLEVGDPWKFMLPNLFMFVGFRKYNEQLWLDTINFEDMEALEPEPIPEIDAKDYSIEKLYEVTNGWRSPAVVRNIFNNTPAVNTWHKQGVLAERLGDWEIPIMVKGIGNVRGREIFHVNDAFSDIINNPKSSLYAFFPNKSRKDAKEYETPELFDKVRQIIAEDLETSDRIQPGFATKEHKIFSFAQLIMGQGTDNAKSTTGTTWHCAIGNNWFAQVHGGKRWFFMDPKHSAYMMPLLGGKRHVVSVMPNMTHNQQFLPIRYTDMTAGDLLYNPDWQWHSILNRKGLSIGVPIREATLGRSFRNNFQYTSLVFWNEIVDFLGLSVFGGYPKEVV